MEEVYNCETCQDTGIIDETCITCNGSGEGVYNGCTCSTCGGRGELCIRCPDCDIIIEDNY